MVIIEINVEVRGTAAVSSSVFIRDKHNVVILCTWAMITY